MIIRVTLPAHLRKLARVDVIAINTLLKARARRYIAAVGHAATQAPQPTQAAASMAVSASPFGTGRPFASGAPPRG